MITQLYDPMLVVVIYLYNSKVVITGTIYDDINGKCIKPYKKSYKIVVT